MLYKEMHLFLFLFAISITATDTSSITTIDEFISETRNTWKYRRKEYYDGKDLLRRPPTRYNLTDSLIVDERSLIHLRGFNVQTHPLEMCISIEGTDAMDQDTSIGQDTFVVFIHYESHRIDNAHATILNIANTNTDSSLSGTEAMLLIHYILKRIGVKTCSLNNCARFVYEYNQYHKLGEEHTLRASIPLINLRCIRGDSTDWYSKFGYLNQNIKEIAKEMKRVHDIQIMNCSLGPMLWKLWNHEDKATFYKMYQRFEGKFSKLVMLRDAGEWDVSFE